MRGKAFVIRFCFPIAQNDRMDKHMKMALVQFSKFYPTARKSPEHARIGYNRLSMGGKAFVNQFCFLITQNYCITCDNKNVIDYVT